MAELVPEDVFGEDYLHFYGGLLGDERSDADTDVAVARAALRPGDRVLDAPCGHGRLAVRLAARGLRVTGVDRAEHLLALARADAGARGVELALVAGDLRRLPVDGPFDAVVCWFTSFGYFDDASNLAVLREFRRVLRPGGTLLVETLSHDGFVRSFTEAPEAIVVETAGGDLLVDRNEFDVEHGRVVCHRVTVRDGVRRDTRFAIRLLTVPEWRRALAEAGFAAVAVTDHDGAAADLETFRLVVSASA
jgi:SAM-dependent methyltransferase